MAFILGALVSVVWPAILAFLTAFWGWLIAGAVAVLGLLFSPSIRKYTLAAIAVAIIAGGLIYFGYDKGYNAPHKPTPFACSEYTKGLKKGPSSDALIKLYQKKGLCK